MAPVYHALAATPLRARVVHTGQHADIAWPLYRFFGMEPHHVLEMPRERPSLGHLSARLLDALDAVVSAEGASAVLVHGDTSSALAAAMAAFYAGIPVGHVEAGLRSGNPLDPFPEEMNRTIIARLARWHFAPTATAAANLTREGCAPAAVSVVGNTVVDAVRYTLATAAAVPDGLPEDLATWALGGRLAVVTMHRRENWGAAIEGVAREVGRALERHPELRVVWPVHPNPDVQAAVAAGVAGLAPGDAARLRLIAPLDYAPMLWLLRAAWLVLTDSGGIQEEAAALDRPVLVLRRTTERPEVIDGGGGALVGTDPAAVAGWIDRLMTDAAAYGAMRCAENPFGDGEAGRRIAGLLTAALADRRRPRADAGPGDAASAAGRPVIDRRTMRMLDDLARTAASGDGHSGDGSGDGHSGDGHSSDRHVLTVSDPSEVVFGPPARHAAL